MLTRQKLRLYERPSQAMDIAIINEVVHGQLSEKLALELCKRGWSVIIAGEKLSELQTIKRTIKSVIDVEIHCVEQAIGELDMVIEKIHELKRHVKVFVNSAASPVTLYDLNEKTGIVSSKSENHWKCRVEMVLLNTRKIREEFNNVQVLYNTLSNVGTIDEISLLNRMCGAALEECEQNNACILRERENADDGDIASTELARNAVDTLFIGKNNIYTKTSMEKILSTINNTIKNIFKQIYRALTPHHEVESVKESKLN